MNPGSLWCRTAGVWQRTLATVGMTNSPVQQFPEPGIQTARGSVPGRLTEDPRAAITYGRRNRFFDTEAEQHGFQHGDGPAYGGRNRTTDENNQQGENQDSRIGTDDRHDTTGTKTNDETSTSTLTLQQHCRTFSFSCESLLNSDQTWTGRTSHIWDVGSTDSTIIDPLKKKTRRPLIRKSIRLSTRDSSRIPVQDSTEELQFPKFAPLQFSSSQDSTTSRTRSWVVIL